jgi:hypothetical protein
MMFRRIFLLLGFASLALASPAPTPYGHNVRAWYLADSTLKSAPPPSARQIEPSTSVDFDGDGIIETITLANSQAIIQTDGQIRWQSPSTWEVRKAQIADLNHDGQPEALLLVWRPFKPWPIDNWLPYAGRIDTFHNSAGKSCHLILIGWYKGSFRERWAGSALAEPVKAFAVADLTGSGEPLLVTLDSSYDDPPSAPARKLKVWEWNGFGFTVVSQLQGAFSQLAIARDLSGQALILAP